jgi:hypothetical protein
MGVTPHRGRMYLSFGIPQDQGGSNLCGMCRARWMQFLAVQGYDLHNHPYAEACSEKCMTKMGGRKTQAMSMREFLLDSKKGFMVGKAIDGMPTVNASAQLISHRVHVFLCDKFRECYAPLLSVDQLVSELQYRAELERAGVPSYALDHHMVVFEAYQSAHSAPNGRIREPAGSRDGSIGPHCVGVTGCSDPDIATALVTAV